MQTETISIHTFKVGDLFDARYRLLRRAGTGGFADVWKAEDSKRNDKVVALKIYSRLDEDGIKEMAKEYDETEDIRHVNLLTANHFATIGNIPYLVMSYCDGGNLLRRAGKMSDAELRHMLRDVCNGLAYLHAEGIVHQDIKPENILYDSRHDRYLLSDFGISSKTRTRLSKSVNMANASITLTKAYAPPEKFSSNPADRLPDTKGDVFSLGITLYEMATGMLPFEQPVNTGDRMQEKQGNVQIYFDNITDPLLRTVVESCLKYRKEDRPAVGDVLMMLDRVSSESQPAVGDAESGKVRRPTVRVKVAESRQPPKQAKPIASAIATPKLKRKWIFIAGASAVVLLALALLRPVSSTELSFSGDSLKFSSGLSRQKYEMVKVGGDTFGMGCLSESVDDCFTQEMPNHAVYVDEFYIGKTEVTQALWESVMGSNPSLFRGDELPVDNVSYDDVLEFVRKLNVLTGKTFRLPTEAEWEYAACGGHKTMLRKYSGSDNVGDVAWYTANSNRRTHPVAQKQPNELGLYDMSGNVSEWCSDWYGSYEYAPGNNPQGPSTGNHRVVRGGCWKYEPRLCRVRYRSSEKPDVRGTLYGFRLAMSASQQN